MRTLFCQGQKGSATQAQNRDRFCGLPESRVRHTVLGTARSGQNCADGEYPDHALSKSDLY